MSIDQMGPLPNKNNPLPHPSSCVWLGNHYRLLEVI
uniref:Uncharacterized protein n=1 Tax=Arundo donax TaxID=35708 RepID=A0A0A8Y1M3_ARUDO